MATSTQNVDIQKPKNGAAGTCRCPACRGLECLERPRYFAGQLLTEAELNSEQAYLLAKNRLHNKYLHGWGVVCGLEVVCHECTGWVRVKSGYALDPCGNDVIVCRDRDFNVLEEIHKCIDARKRADEDCPPWVDPGDTCVEKEEHWCIALEYRENETRGVMPLQEKSAGQGGCGCSSKSSTASTPAPRPAACEATRVLEQYRLTVIPEPASCAGDRTQEQFLSRLGAPSAFPANGTFTSALATLIPEAFRNHPLVQTLIATAPAGTLLARLLSIAESMESFFAARFNVDDRSILVKAVRACLSTPDMLAERPFWTGGGVTVMTVDLCGRFRRAVRDLYLQNPLNVRCQPFQCPPCEETKAPPPDFVPRQSAASNRAFHDGDTPPTTGNNDFTLTSFCCLSRALVNYVVDAVCSALLPPCPPDPCGERVILACVTISKDQRIVAICNHSCRRYAGSFPALEYWTSAAPIVPLAQRLLREICCAPNAAPVIVDVMSALRQFRDTGPIIDPKLPDDKTGGDPHIPPQT